MSSWESGGIAPIYLCESHEAQVNYSRNDVPAATSPTVCNNRAIEHAERGVSSDVPPNREVESGDEISRSLVSVPRADSATLLADDVNEGVTTEDFEAHGTVLLSNASTASEDTKMERSDPERLCVSGFGERCAYESTVHCPKCMKWFCDTHAEDRMWHPCALST